MPHSTPRAVAPRSALVLGLALLAAAAAAIGGRTGAFAQGAEAEGSSRMPATQRLVLALYYYSYQGDPRKGIPARDIRNAQGLCQFTYHPWESVGPWLTFDRAQWHRTQFEMMAAGGVDVALPLYRGDRAGRAGYAVKGLDVMTQALKELRSGGQAPFARAREYPQIGMALDLGGLAELYGGPVDLKDADVQRSLYGMIRDFYLHVPEEFRAAVLLPAARRTGEEPGAASTPRGCAHIVRLVGDEAVRDADNSFLRYAGARFAREFGARLVWVGTPALKARASELDTAAPYPAALQPAHLDTGGWLHSASVGPGYDDSSQGPGGKIRPRENGRQTVEDFRKVIPAAPDWIFIDSWNGYRQGTDIAPTLEHGLTYRDLTRAAILDYKQASEYAASILRASAPRVVQPGHVYQVDVTVQNTGIEDWTAFNVASLTYRWLRDGMPVGEIGFPIGSDGQARGESKNYTLGVVAPLQEGKPLPPGEYELEFNMSRRDGDSIVWFDQEHTAPYRLPVTVGPAQPGRPFWVSSTLPTLVRSGASYPAQVRVRNDGSDTWKKGTFSVGYRWRKVSCYLKGVSEESDVVLNEGRGSALPEDVPPGRVVTLEVPVSTTDAQGRPLPTWNPAEPWSYVLEWEVFDGGKALGKSGGAAYREAVEVLDRDPGASFLGCSLPAELVAGRTEKITVGLRNLGPDAWKRERDRVVVHWYYMDGTEASWNDDALPLPEDVPPFSRVQVQVSDTGPAADDKKGRKGRGERTRTETMVRDMILREVPVRVPYYFGPMYCVLDFQHDGMFASTSLASKGTDILVIAVNVYSPTFTPMPLTGYFNVDGMSEDVARADGNIDGRGNSLPVEFLPPYVARPSAGAEPAPSPLYPSGLWVRPLNDLESSRVCFLYPSKASGQPNMLACQGERIELAPLPRSAVHLLAVCTEEDVRGDYILYYADGSSEKRTLTFTHWNDPPKHGERTAFLTPHRHTRAGDDPSTKCYINHYTLPADRLKNLLAVELPRLPAVKVIAMTLESAGLAAAP